MFEASTGEERAPCTPMLSLRRASGLVVLAALAVLALPGSAGAAGCPDQPLARTFQPWLDPAWYQAAPDGGLEAGAEGWTLGGGAAVVAGNEPFFVGDSGDARSLSLPAGASATTPDVCIGVEHPTLRFFARNTGSVTSTLGVSVVFRDVLGLKHTLPVGVVVADDEWAPTPVVPVVVNLLSLLGDQDVAFRFTALDNRGEWTIDDVYVDPYKKG
jgi:hypothetical protein